MSLTRVRSARRAPRSRTGRRGTGPREGDPPRGDPARPLRRRPRESRRDERLVHLASRSSGRGIDPSAKEGELALLFVRMYRSLDALLGDSDTASRWFRAENLHLGGVPAELVRKPEGSCMSSSIWTRCAGSSRRRRLEATPWRVVENQHSSSTWKLVDSEEEHELLERLVEEMKPRLLPGPEFEGVHWLLFTPPLPAPAVRVSLRPANRTRALVRLGRGPPLRSRRTPTTGSFLLGVEGGLAPSPDRALRSGRRSTRRRASTCHASPSPRTRPS